MESEREKLLRLIRARENKAGYKDNVAFLKRRLAELDSANGSVSA